MSISIILLPTWGVRVLHITSVFVYVSATNQALGTETVGTRYSYSVTECYTPN